MLRTRRTPNHPHQEFHQICAAERHLMQKDRENRGEQGTFATTMGPREALTGAKIEIWPICQS
jgi:hypothetical protein